MLAIADQSARPNRLKFFEGTHECQKVKIRFKKKITLIKIVFF